MPVRACATADIVRDTSNEKGVRLMLSTRRACSLDAGRRPCRRTQAGRLTELVEVRLNPVRPGHGADEPGLQEGAPLVDQAAVTTVVILRGGGGVKDTVKHPPGNHRKWNSPHRSNQTAVCDNSEEGATSGSEGEHIRGGEQKP